MLISSQRYLDQAIVAAKIQDGDYEVTVSPEFDLGGDVISVLLDGHHSYAAAKQAGVQPTIIVADKMDHDAVALIEGDAELFLEVVHMGDEWYVVETGESVW